MQNIGTGTNKYDCLGKITKLTVNLHENISELLIAYLTKGWIHSAWSYIQSYEIGFGYISGNAISFIVITVLSKSSAWTLKQWNQSHVNIDKYIGPVEMRV